MKTSIQTAARWSMLAAALFALAGCGFRPLYANPDLNALANVEIETGQDRVDFLLEEALSDATGVADAPSPYRVVIETEADERRLGVSAADRATRFAYELSIRYAVFAEGEAAPITQGGFTQVAYYDAPNSPFAIVSARRDVEERAACQAAERLARDLAAALQRQDP